MDDISAAHNWLNRYLRHAQATDRALYEAASREMALAGSRAVTQIVHTSFRRQRPTESACRQALASFASPELDFQALGRYPALAPLAEFPATLLAIRSEAGYRVDPTVSRDPDQLTRYPMRLASLEAAVAAQEQGDSETARSIFGELAAAGDGRSAQTIGTMYLSGKPALRDGKQAYRWFYASWALGNAEGLNAMGVLVRDGASVPADPRLAFAAFSLAATVAAAASDTQARARAEANAKLLMPGLKNSDLEAIACLSMQGLDQQLRQHVADGVPVAARKLQLSSQSLGELVPALQSHASDCR